MKEFFELSAAQQEQLLDRLTDHALCKMRKLKWRGAYVARGGSIPGGYEPHDLAHDALVAALDGKKRKWNRNKYATFERFVLSVIDSKVSALVNRAENKCERRMSPDTGDDGNQTGYEDDDEDNDPLVIVIDQEARDKFREAALKELQGEEFLVQLLECLEADIIKPADIAETLSTEDTPITANDVNNAMKRLERKLKKLDTRIKPAKKGKQ